MAVAFEAEPESRLAGVLDALSHAGGPAFLDADHDPCGDVGIGAGADQRAEVKTEAGAELQPAVGMRQRERALDAVLHRLRRGVREVVDRQDDDMVAHADAAIFAAVAPEACFGQVHRLPAPGFDVMDMKMLALLDRLHHSSDVDAVLDHGIAGPVVLQRHLVADRNVAFGGHVDVFVVFHDPAVELLAGLDAFDDDHSDAVAFFMHYEMDHRVILFAWIRNLGSCSRPRRGPMRRRADMHGILPGPPAQRFMKSPLSRYIALAQRRTMVLVSRRGPLLERSRLAVDLRDRGRDDARARAGAPSLAPLDP